MRLLVFGLGWFVGFGLCVCQLARIGSAGSAEEAMDVTLRRWKAQRGDGRP